MGFSSVIRLWAENSGQTVDGREESSAPAPSWSNSAHLASRDLSILLISGSVAVLREAIEASRKEFGGREGGESKRAPGIIRGSMGEPHLVLNMVGGWEQDKFPIPKEKAQPFRVRVEGMVL